MPNILLVYRSNKLDLESMVAMDSKNSDRDRRRLRMPPGAWDSHMHIMDGERYPNYSRQNYTLSERYTLSAALAFESTLGIERIVIVQPSCYGTDNSCVIDALRELGPTRGRGVVVFDPDEITESTLREWHQCGVRGVRVNLQSVDKKLDNAELSKLLERYAALIGPLGWVIQFYVPLHVISELEGIVSTLKVRVCFDHFGQPSVPQDLDGNSEQSSGARPSWEAPYSIPGFASLVRLLERGNTYVKLSAPYRISKMLPHFPDLDPVAQELLRVAGKSRVVYASDWPHTRFGGMDIGPWTDRVLDWCEASDGLAERIFRDNARDLWDVRE